MIHTTRNVSNWLEYVGLDEADDMECGFKEYEIFKLLGFSLSTQALIIEGEGSIFTHPPPGRNIQSTDWFPVFEDNDGIVVNVNHDSPALFLGLLLFVGDAFVVEGERTFFISDNVPNWEEVTHSGRRNMNGIVEKMIADIRPQDYRSINF